ncbi:MAG: DEAD/DEAH box helicase [Myxococcales bacterium]|nr:DEAD/DEAH box helicase [Myxococcales bacterium]MCB9581019.1 DEAD/DEAH box helicase [Polyangiaceae bacterium]
MSQPLTIAAPLAHLSGVGPALANTFDKAGLATVADLLWLLPRSYDDREQAVTVAEAVERAPRRPHLVVKGTVKRASFVPGRRRRRMLRVEIAGEDDARLTAFWFFAAHGILARAKPGAACVLAGRVAPPKRGPGAMMAHPDLWLDDAPKIVPRYPRVSGVSGERLRHFLEQALEANGSADPVPAAIALREGFAPLDLERIHRPAAPVAVSELRAAREHLAWAEAFARTWLRAQRRQELRATAPGLPPAPKAVRALESALGFTFTASQDQAIAEIAQDLAGPEPMRRLLLGDVGAGKTGVALAAAAQAHAARAQTLIFAPTTALADQYGIAADALTRAVGARTAVLTGATPAAERRAVLSALREHDIDVLIGTHALLGEGLEPARLGLVVVDEQQRLGVAQRLAVARGRDPHLLTLSATPIPRTLALALRGELETSELRELPPGRRPVVTRRVVRSAWFRDVPTIIRETIERDENTFVVCPRIDADDEDDDGPSATERDKELRKAFGDQVVLAHARLPVAERRAALARFRSGQARVLVGTSVVEVGIDVPQATLMVIDGAEHFGLGQLHQLRGRVGRSQRPSTCLLVHDEPLTELAEQRLETLERTERGADVARADLAQRGAGDLSGTRQSGESGLEFLDAFADAPWLERIAEDVRALTRDDPELSQHPALKAFVARAPELAAREEAG